MNFSSLSAIKINREFNLLFHEYFFRKSKEIFIFYMRIFEFNFYDLSFILGTLLIYAEEINLK